MEKTFQQKRTKADKCHTNPNKPLELLISPSNAPPNTKTPSYNPYKATVSP
jgi:hypothetical protein